MRRARCSVAQDALALGLDVLELTALDGPPQAAEDEEHQHDGQRDQQEQDVHQRGSRAVRGTRTGCISGSGTGKARDRRKAFNTTSSELAAMPSPASQAGIQPATAMGTL